MMRQTLQTLLNSGRGRLEQNGNPEAELDAKYLLFEAFGTDMVHFLMDRLRELPDDEKTRMQTVRYYEMIALRGQRVPLQQILGTQDFMGLTFSVNRHVLIPRQDTETLVELVLKEHPGEGERILDLCTGSGCIAISLAALGKYGSVTAVDLSHNALEVAEKNREQLLGGQAGLVELWEGDLFSALPEDCGTFDILVSNPPYIPTRVIESLEPEVRDFEPRMALDGSADGLEFYRRIVSESKTYLKPGGSVYLEIGYDQGEAVRALLQQEGFDDVRVVKDAPGKDRVAAARWNPHQDAQRRE